MKKGFTLIELLAVIVILAIILVIAVPQVLKVISDARLNGFSASSKTLEKAATTYLSANSIIVGDGTTTAILYSDIKSSGYISEVVDPISNSECIKSRVYVTNTGGNYTYKGALVCDNYMDIDTYNLIVNSNFSNGTTGWEGVHATISAINNVATVTGAGTSDYSMIRQTTSIPKNSYIYARISVRMTDLTCNSFILRINGSTSSDINVTTINNPVLNQWHVISGIRNLSADTGFVRVSIRAGYADAATANGKVMQVDGTKGVYAFDLTSIYGAGNEPTVAQMDNIMSNMGK